MRPMIPRRMHRCILLCFLGLGSSMLLPPVRAAPLPLQLTLSTPDIPNGSPFGVTVVVRGDLPRTPLTLTGPQDMQWRLIPAGCTGTLTITCTDLTVPWVGTFDGQIWALRGERLIFRATLDDQVVTASGVVTAWEPPPTPIPPVTATTVPTQTPIPTATPSPPPTATTPPRPTAPPATATPLPALLPTSLPPVRIDQSPPTAIPQPLMDSAERPPDPAGGLGAAPLGAATTPPTPSPSIRRGVVIAEQPRMAAGPTSLPPISVALPLLACYDRNQSASCDADEGIRGLTAYVTDAQTGSVLGQGLTDDAGQARILVRVAPSAELLISVPSYAWTQRVSAQRPTIPALRVTTIAPLPALVP